MAEEKKKRKRRKPMSPEQKAAAAERLAKAREKRLRENPPQYKSIHESVLELDDEHPWHHLKVKEWIKTQKGLLSAEKRNMKLGAKGAEAKVASIESYIRNLDAYLKSGNYIDMRWGEYAENSVGYVCRHLAYDEDGNVKRTQGVFYPDINAIWGVDNSTYLE